MSRHRLLALIFASATLVGCAHHGYVYVASAPPPPIYEEVTVSPRTGYVWVPGYHHWNGHSYVWVGGRWRAAPRHRSHWVEGHWEHSHRGYYWVEGYWR